MTQEDVLKEVLARIFALPDKTPLGKNSLSKPYCHVEILPDGSYKQRYGSTTLPKPIKTVKDLKAVPFHVLVSYPNMGLKKLAQLMASMAEKNGIDVAFVRNPQIIPTDPEMRILHALHHGYAVVLDQYELPNPRSPTGGTKLQWCHVAYQNSDGHLVSTKASEAYNGQPGNKAGIAGSYIKSELLKKGEAIEKKSSIVLTEKGREVAEAQWGKTPQGSKTGIMMGEAVKSRLEDGRIVPECSTDLADRLARMADREQRLEKRAMGNGRGDAMSSILYEAEAEIRRLRDILGHHSLS